MVLVAKRTGSLKNERVTPLLTQRSPLISDNRVERLERVVLAATKQCQRLYEMRIHPPLDIANIAEQVRRSKLSFLALAKAPPLLKVLTSQRDEPEGLIIIGPEGDFAEKELNILTEAGAAKVGLGQHQLRVETATVALLAILMLWYDRNNQITVDRSITFIP
ncbi:hypothetical protein MLD38_036099 [Melastoma candidum]|uniref:Uncharacterized protein n=1 Tax=Melastoma candidum TaxID=119954 RepID=A0ACB9LIP2_9MYRT|nr:hypothetical protein MLD38_036099 [Melastoma candidum]